MEYILGFVIILAIIFAAVYGWFSKKSIQIRESQENKKIREELKLEKVKFDNNIKEKEREFNSKESNLKVLETKITELKNGILKLASEKAFGFPFLAKAYDEYFELKDDEEEFRLRHKSHPAPSKAQKYKEAAAVKREILFRNRILKYQIEYYEYLFPWLTEYKDVEIDDDTIQRYLESKDKEVNNENEEHDPAENWLPAAEYMSLPSVKRNQMALDRYWSTKKSPWEVGRLYESYIGYLYEQQGYNVTYHGILEGYDDMGRDLICKKADQTIIVQCKCWGQHKIIHEKHINQLYGTCAKYFMDLESSVLVGDLFDGFKSKIKISKHFVTSAQLSERSKKFADALGIVYKENFPLKCYPCIKCNISRKDNEPIYHLPFDQQYDKVVIEKERGEFYASTVLEAEQNGFRRAWRWRENG